MGLGPTETVSLAQARILTRKARLAFEAGRDPIAERAAANGVGRRNTVTFGRFASELIDGVEGGFRSEKHRKQWRSTLAIHASRLTDRPINEISTDDIFKPGNDGV